MLGGGNPFTYRSFKSIKFPMDQGKQKQRDNNKTPTTKTS